MFQNKNFACSIKYKTMFQYLCPLFTVAKCKQTPSGRSTRLSSMDLAT